MIKSILGALISATLLGTNNVGVAEPLWANTPVPVEREYLGEYKLTAYCSCSKCCGVYAENRPVDAYGNEIVYGSIGLPLTQGYSVAVDPSVIPYGTVLVIDGHKYEAMDCGGAIKGNKLDVYFNNHDEALEFGVQYANVYREIKQ